jgi:hypothetical protein
VFADNLNTDKITVVRVTRAEEKCSDADRIQVCGLLSFHPACIGFCVRALPVRAMS